MPSSVDTKAINEIAAQIGRLDERLNDMPQKFSQMQVQMGRMEERQIGFASVLAGMPCVQNISLIRQNTNLISEVANVLAEIKGATGVTTLRDTENRKTTASHIDIISDRVWQIAKIVFSLAAVVYMLQDMIANMIKLAP